ncbi:MAG: hypothetical protein ACI4PC_07315 [Oscillospiraceae bacterium]
MKNTINRVLYIIVGVALVVVAFVLETYALIFMGACVIVLGVTGGNNFTKKFEGGLFREGLFKRHDKNK